MSNLRLAIRLSLIALGTAVATGTFAQTADDGAVLPGANPDAPPVFIVELLIFSYNEFNPYEEEFRPEKPQRSTRLQELARRPLANTPYSGPPELFLDDVLQSAGLQTGSGATRDPGIDPPGSGVTRNAGIAPPGPGATQNRGTIPPPMPASGNRAGVAAASTGGSNIAWHRLLGPEELELGRAFARLNTLGAYTPLVHAGWVQPALLEDEAEPFGLGALGRLQPAGSIRLHRSRFLHLTVDVSLQQGYRFTQAPQPVDTRWPLSEFEGPVQYRIDAQRRVRSGELHFFDHPAFGVLITVRPAPAEPATDGASPQGPAA